MPQAHDRWIPATPAGANAPHAAGRIDVLLRILDAVRHPRPGTGPIGARRIATHFVRCAAHLHTFRDWFGNPANPALRSELATRPYLLTCVVHPYLNSGWLAPRKLAVIAEHYAMLHGRLALLRSATSVPLADADGGLRIEVARPGKFEHEGESTIRLRQGDDELYALAFTLGTLDGQRVAYVGALQGMNRPDAIDIYRELTHRLHGLRPRDLLVTAFRRLSLAMGVARILAVDDARRVSSNPYFATSGRVLSSYDAVWDECGGVAGAEGFFALSPQASRREADAVPARKRALYRRRYAMLDALGLQIDAAVGAAR